MNIRSFELLLQLQEAFQISVTCNLKIKEFLRQNL